MSASRRRRRSRKAPQAEPVRERGSEGVRSGRKPGRKEKSPGLVVNKSAEIRRVAATLVSEGQPPRPKVIKERLLAENIEVSSAQVSTALTDTDFAFRRNKADWERPQIVFPDPVHALRQVSIEDVMEARKFVEKLGGIDRAMAALVALRQFGGEQVAATERTDAPTSAADGHSPEKERAAMRLTS